MASLQAQAPHIRAGWKPGVAGEPGNILSPVFYVDANCQVVAQMIVLANDKGAAAVRFTASDPMPGVTSAKLEYRYESFGKTQKTGEGERYEQRNEAGVMGGNGIAERIQ